MDLLRLNIQHFADEATDNSSAHVVPKHNPHTHEMQTDQAVTPEGNEKTDTAQEAEEKLFKQEDVNNITAKESKKVRESMLKELGIEDFTNAKEGMKKFREWQESQKTEQEKLNEKLTTFESQLGEKDSKLTDLQAENAAIKAGITDDKNLEAVITLAKTKVSEEVDINAAIKQVVEDYPQFAGQAQQEEQKPSFTTGTHTKQSSNDAFAKALLGQ